MKCTKSFKKSGETYEKGKDYPQVTAEVANGFEAYYGESRFEKKVAKKIKKEK